MVVPRVCCFGLGLLVIVWKTCGKNTKIWSVFHGCWGVWKFNSIQFSLYCMKLYMWCLCNVYILMHRNILCKFCICCKIYWYAYYATTVILHTTCSNHSISLSTNCSNVRSWEIQRNWSIRKVFSQDCPLTNIIMSLYVSWY